MTDIPDTFISKAKEIYESNWPDPVLAIAEALMEASNTPPAKKAGERDGGRAPMGEPMRFIREVAMLHTGDECLMWPYSRTRDGYGRVRVGSRTVGAHRYICELVHGMPPNHRYEAAHSCGKGHLGCVSPGHLLWKTRAGNHADMVAHGTHNRGERHRDAKLTEAEVREIIALKGVEIQRNIAKRFGVSRSTIANIHAGANWAWLSEPQAISSKALAAHIAELQLVLNEKRETASW